MSEFFREDAELSLLGACIADSVTCDEVLRLVRSEMFFNPYCREIFRALKDMRDEGIPSDDVTAIAFELNIQFDDPVTAKKHLVAAAEKVFTHKNERSRWQYWSNTVRDLWRVRETIGKCAELERLARQSCDGAGVDIGSVLTKALADFQDLQAEASGDLLHISAIDHNLLQEGVRTGFEPLDALTGVGLVSGQVTAVSAYHKAGKTTFCLQLAESISQFHPVIYATFADLPPEGLKKRLLKQLAYGGREAAAEHLNASNLFVYHGKKHGRDVDSLCAKARGFAVKHGSPVVIADYIQRIHGVGKTKVEEMEYVSGRLSDLAEDLGKPVVVGSQVTRTEGDVWITKHSRALEEDAALVIRIKRTPDSDEATIEVPFNRFGPSATLDARFIEEYVKFEVLA